MIAALYIAKDGPYFGRPDIDGWDEARDATLYNGDLPVLAHPPCARWCQLAGVVEKRYGYKRGDDGGTFASALASVRRCGGVLEHPAFTKAWPAFGLPRPSGHFWQQTLAGEWVCQVAQCAYGHRARKLTWLLYVGKNPPHELRWHVPAHRGVVSGMRNNCGRPLTERLWPAEAKRTPPEFAAELERLVRDCGGAP